MITRGDIVYDAADERHHGRVERINHRPSGSVAHIVWLETGWHSYGVPVADLRPVVEREVNDGQTASFVRFAQAGACR